MWRHYLLPMKFVLYTDHQALKYLNSQGKLNQKMIKLHATITERCDEVCTNLSSMLDGKGNKVEYRIVSTITYTREVVGGC